MISTHWTSHLVMNDPIMIGVQSLDYDNYRCEQNQTIDSEQTSVVHAFHTIH